MALAVSNVKRRSSGAEVIVYGKLAFSGSYSTGGEALDFAAYAGVTNRQPDFVEINGLNGHLFPYDFTNKKVKVMGSSPGGANQGMAEHGATTYDSTVSTNDVRFRAVWLAVPNLT